MYVLNIKLLLGPKDFLQVKGLGVNLLDQEVHHEGQYTTDSFTFIRNHQEWCRSRNQIETHLMSKVLEQEKDQAEGMHNRSQEWWFLQLWSQAYSTELNILNSQISSRVSL